jgi:alkylhydroperoxidase family enzyme
VGRESGVTEAQLAALPRYRESDAFDEREKLVLDLAVAMTRTPADVPRALAAALSAYFDEAQLVELAAAIAWENHRARFNRAFDVQAVGYSEGTACALPERHGSA